MINATTFRLSNMQQRAALECHLALAAAAHGSWSAALEEARSIHASECYRDVSAELDRTHELLATSLAAATFFSRHMRESVTIARTAGELSRWHAEMSLAIAAGESLAGCAIDEDQSIELLSKFEEALGWWTP